MLLRYLTRGVKAGLVAGLVFGLFVALVANPLVGYADGANHAVEGEHGGEGAVHGHAESDHDAGGGHAGEGDHHDSAVSGAVDTAVSVVAGGLWAVLLGGVFFGLVYYVIEPAIPGTGATKSYVLAAAGFVTVSGAPWLVLPPVAPGAEQSLPVATRLALYGGMMVAGGLACLAAGYAYSRIGESRGRVPAVLAAVLPLALLAVPAVLAPSNAGQGGLPPALRTGLMGLSVFGQALVWLLLAAAHAQFRPDDGRTQFERSTPDTAVGAD
jgi:hypothetical protein